VPGFAVGYDTVYEDIFFMVSSVCYFNSVVSYYGMNTVLTLGIKIDLFIDHVVDITAFYNYLQTKDTVLKSQSDLQNLKMQVPVLKEGGTNLVIPEPCQKGTFSTSTQPSQVVFINMFLTVS
jgi:hypothetical protein